MKTSIPASFGMLVLYCWTDDNHFMTHKDHVRLIKDAIPHNTHQVWADMGSGDGAFTLALRDVGGKGIEIYSIDQDAMRLATQKRAFAQFFPQSNIHFLKENFMKSLHVPLLDGIVMANSLHYVKDKAPFLLHLQKYLKPSGKFVLVEYNVDKGNIWVPYPLSFSTFEKLCQEIGFQKPQFLHSVSSQFLHEIYACLTTLPA